MTDSLVQFLCDRLDDSKRQLVNASNIDCPTACALEHTFSGSCALRWMGPAWEADGQRWVHDENGTQVPAPPAIPVWALHLLAQPYSDHPDYCEEWRPRPHRIRP